MGKRAKEDKLNKSSMPPQLLNMHKLPKFRKHFQVKTLRKYRKEAFVGRNKGKLDGGKGLDRSRKANGEDVFSSLGKE